MILAAVTLICIGLVLLVIYFKQAGFGVSQENQNNLSSAAIKSPLPNDDKNNSRESSLYQESQIKQTQKENRPVESKGKLPINRLKQIDPDSLRDAISRVTLSESMSSLKSEQLITKGILFLDKGRRLPGMMGKFSELPVRFFDELRRIGTGNLIIEEGAFIVRSGNATYHYSIGDLDQILFQPSGVALVPVLPDRSVALFITKEAEAIRSFMKEHVRMKSVY